LATETLVPVASGTAKGITSDRHIYVDDPDAMRYYEHRADAMTLQPADIIPNHGELWVVMIVKKKAERGTRDGIFWQVTIESPRGTTYSFDPRWEALGARGPSDLRNLRFYRPRRGF
jgi:hypothetical protein